MVTTPGNNENRQLVLDTNYVTNEQNESESNQLAINVNKLELLRNLRHENRLHFNWICHDSTETRGSRKLTNKEAPRKKGCGALNYSYTDGGRTQRQCPRCGKWTRLNEGTMDFQTKHVAQARARADWVQRRNA